MNSKNAEGYADPTVGEAIGNVSRGGKLDYTKFKTYEELQEYTIEHNRKITTKAEADKFIREKMPKESHFQKKIIDWIKENVPNAVVWKEAAGPYSRQGIPDITCIVNGKYYGFEVKRPFIGVLSKIQEQTIKELRKAGAVAEVVTSEKEVAKILLSEEKPLTLPELKEMAGEPVWCPEMEAYGIVKCDKIGTWAGIPFLHGSWYDKEDGISVDFEYDIQKRKLKCYRIGGSNGKERV